MRREAKELTGQGVCHQRGASLQILRMMAGVTVWGEGQRARRTGTQETGDECNQDRSWVAQSASRNGQVWGLMQSRDRL